MGTVTITDVVWYDLYKMHSGKLAPRSCNLHDEAHS